MALVTKLTNGVIGQVATISTEGSETSGTGTYSIEYEFGSLTGVIKDNMSPKAIPTTINWTIPTSFYNQIPDTTSKTGKLISYYTSNGDKTVNSTSTFTAKIADGYVPTITASVVTTDSLSSQLSGNTSTIINGVSNVQITMAATPTQGSSIVNQYCRNTSNFYSFTISNTKTITGTYDGIFNFGAIDTRSRTGTKIISLTAIDYRRPTISLDNVSISTSGVATISISGTWFNGSFGKTSNGLTISYRYKSSSSSSWGSWTTITNVTKNSDGTYSATGTRSGLSYTTTYNFEARVQDAINTVSSREYSGKSLPIFDWSEDDFNFNVPVHITQYYSNDNPTTKRYVDDLTEVLADGVQNNTDKITAVSNRVSALEGSSSSVGKSDVVDWIYPVGSIYISVNSTNPRNLFGGTWTQLKDRFLLGAGSTYTNGSTGGEASHTLTANEIPKHVHLLGAADSSGNLMYGASGVAALPAYTAYAKTTSAATSGVYRTGTENNNSTQIAHNNMPPYLVVYMWKRTA